MALDLDKLKADVYALSDASLRLNDASDQLTVAVAVIEAAVNTLALGVECRIELPPLRGGAQIWFGYGRSEKTWGFLVWQEDDCWIWDRAPRWLRLRTIDHIPKLLQALNTTAYDLAKDLETAATVAKGMISGLQK